MAFLTGLSPCNLIIIIMAQRRNAESFSTPDSYLNDIKCPSCERAKGKSSLTRFSRRLTSTLARASLF